MWGSPQASETLRRIQFINAINIVQGQYMQLQLRARVTDAQTNVKSNH